MAVFGDEMEAPAAIKWPKAVMGDEREREREIFNSNEEEEGDVRILTFCFIITDRFFVSNNLIK